MSSALRCDRGGGSKEGAGCGLRVHGNALTQPAAGEAIRPVDLHNAVPGRQDLTAQANLKEPRAFNCKNRPVAQLQSPFLENAVTLTIGWNAALV